MKISNFFSFFILLLPFFSPASASVGVERENQKGLAQSYAEYRSSWIDEVQYFLSIDISEKADYFRGKSEIVFQSKEKGLPLAIDFAEGDVISVTLNDQPIKTPYNGIFISIPKDLIKNGKNKIAIEYKHAYGKNGSGLYKYLDQEDGKTYLYSDFEPYDANRLFPCLDQPDLKATYTLKVTAPADWTVVSASPEWSTEDLKEQKKLWSFKETKKFSTYIFSLHAGPYFVWKDEYKKMPLRLFARQSLAKYVLVKEWFDITKKGFKFFEDKFKMPYPFGKYDQLVVPEFNAGAMENVAAVTFSERYIRRGKSTVDENEALAGVILHEMAHMWFGNLVTMKWWNDLWLNESFASYVSFWALQEATQFKQSWQTFFTQMKQRAILEDQLVTTHPVEFKVENTEQAFAYFDGITYGKGASLLKQLYYYVEPDKFEKGLQNYFKKYAYGNTTRENFIDALQETAKVDLKSWTEQWLQTTGVTTLKPDYFCQNGKVTQFTLEQIAQDHQAPYRAHRVKVGLYGSGSRGLELNRSETVLVAGPRTNIDAFIGTKCPDLVVPDIADYGYFKILFDSRSQETLISSLTQVSDDLIRLMLWRTAWQMVRDQQMSVFDYAQMAEKHLPREQNTRIVSAAIESIIQRRNDGESLLLYFPRDQKLEVDKVNRFFTMMETMGWKEFDSSEKGSDIQKIWFDAAIRFSNSKNSQERLKNLLSKTKVTELFDLDQDRRWQIILHLNSIGNEKAPQLAEQEAQKDQTESGKKMFLACKAVRPDPKLKKDLVTSILAEKEQFSSFADLMTVVSNLYPVRQQDLKLQNSKLFLERLPKLNKVKDPNYMAIVSRYLAPVNCTGKGNKELKTFVQEAKGIQFGAVKQLKAALDSDERCLKVRQYALSSNKK